MCSTMASKDGSMRMCVSAFVVGVLLSSFLLLMQLAHRSIPVSEPLAAWQPQIFAFNHTSSQQHLSQTPQDPFNGTHPIDRIKVPFPIFVASLPKSGTTSTARYFYCGKIWTAHTFCNTVGTTHAPRKQMRIGHCFLENMQSGRPPFWDCGKYHVWSDAGHPRGTPCFYPSVHGLQAFYDAYPNATLLLTTRNSTAWALSIQRWKGGELLKKWRRCEQFPGPKSTTVELANFYDWHVQNLRNFAAQHKSLTYVEVALEDDAIGNELEEHIGVPAECFGHHNSHEKRLQLNPRFRRQFEEQQNRANTTNGQDR